MIKNTYRADIDGLRGISVLLVMMYHLGLGAPGGYIGVDVFFVISGFLITGIIKRETEEGVFTFAGFYARRARRILPAMLAVMLLSSIAAFVILLPSDLERYAKSMVAAVLSVSNFWFWSQGGYFGPDSAMAPMLHTWSLSVEEQFYILFPIALIMLYRFKPHRCGQFLVVGCFGTFTASAWFVVTRTPEVFYLSPFRAWEFLLGSLLAFYHLPVVAHYWYRQLIAAVGLMLIVVPACIFTNVTLFPGPAAAVPCIGAALLIWIGTSGESTIVAMLKSRVLVFIGLISFSLYLWHWPLLVFAKYAMGEDLNIDGKVGIGFVSIALATLSWRFVELPFRSRERTTNRQSWAFLGIALALLGAFVAEILLTNGLSKRFTPKVADLDRARVRQVVRPECIDLRVPMNDTTTCRVGAQGEPTVLVWGDSHAHAMLPAFDAAFLKLGVTAWFATESGCPPLPYAQVSFRGRDNWRCREHNDKVVKFIGEHLEIEKILLVAAWNSYADEAGGYELSTPTSGKSAAALKKSIEELAQWQYPNQKSRELIVVSQIPSFEWSVPHKMLDRELKGKPIPPLTRQEWLNKSTKSRDIFESLAISKHIILVDSSEWLCNTGVCSYTSNNDQPLYWDGGHINAIGANYIAPFLEVEFLQYFLNSKELKRK